MTSEIDPEGNVDEYFYFPENDPDGDGDTSPGTRPGLDTTTGGYLKEKMTDSITSPRRIEPTPPVQIRTQYFYDAVGNTIRTIDGRGIQTDYSVNQLNQIVQTIRASAYVYDPASNVIRVRSDGEPVDDVAGDSGNRTLAVTEYIYDECSRVFVTHQALFQTPDATPTRTPTLTDTPAMDSLVAYLSDAPSDTAGVPGAVSIAVIGQVSTLTGYDRSSRVVFTIQDDLDAYRTDYDGADRAVKTVDSALSNGFSGSVFNPANVAGNTVETAYDDNSNVIERLETDVTTVSGVANEVFRTTYLYDSLDRLQPSWITSARRRTTATTRGATWSPEPTRWAPSQGVPSR